MWRVPWVSLMRTPCISLLHHLMLGSIPRSWKFLPCPVVVQLNGLCLVTFGVDRMPYTHPCSVSSTLSTIATVGEYHVWKTLVSPACGITKAAQTEVVPHKLRNPRFCCAKAQKLARWKRNAGTILGNVFSVANGDLVSEICFASVRPVELPPVHLDELG